MVTGLQFGGVPYLVEDVQTGFLVDCGDTEALGEKIKLILNNKDLRRKFRQNAKQKALKEFQTEKIDRKTYEVYR